MQSQVFGRYLGDDRGREGDVVCNTKGIAGIFSLVNYNTIQAIDLRFLLISLGIKLMNKGLSIDATKIFFIFAGLLSLILILVYVVTSQMPKQFLFGATWSLEDLEQNFIGELPKSAVDIQYQSLATYGLLNFKSSPSEALEFAKRFCYGTLLEGYDPFNSIDNHDSSTGYLIQTHPEYFYYSHSINNLSTQLGNRCSDIKRGGLHQVVVYTKDDSLYEVKLEISATCTNQNAAHPCDGIAVTYTSHGSMQLGEFYTAKSRYAVGDSWKITVEPNKQYKLIVRVKDIQQVQSHGDFQVSILPVITSGNEPYCEACWVVTHGSSQNELEISFVGSPTGLTTIRLFWMTKDEHIYHIRVVQNT